MSATPDNYQLNVHQFGMTVTWSLLFNVSVFCAILRHSKTAQISHSILSFMILISTYVFILYFLVPFGFNIVISQTSVLMYVHGVLGCALLGLVALQVTGGVLARFWQLNQLADIFKLQKVKNAHKYTGYTIAVIYKINILWSWGVNGIFIFLIIWEVCWIAVLVYLKRFYSKLQKTIIDRQTITARPIQIKRISDIERECPKYILFGNYLYDAGELQAQHPGGHQVIQSILGREVDRFLYGMYSSELFPQLKPYSHSSSCLKLVGNPIVRIVVPPPFSGITSETFKVKIMQVQTVSSKTQIYALGLISVQNSLIFQGYSDIRQLGQYYSLTLAGSVTRLYTAVNFLAKQNIALMNKLIQKNDFLPLYKKRQSSVLKQAQLTNLQGIKVALMDEDSNQRGFYLPIMLKVYNNGQLTSALLKANFQNLELTLSEPKGRGLQLETTAPGRIIIVAGGTGLFPFSDLIDLVFKSQLIQALHPLSQEIIERNPLLKSRPFQKFTFVLLVAINETQDIHPITMRQLLSLSADSSKFKVVMRVSKNQTELSGFKSGIEFTRDYFTERALKEGQNKDFSRFWICGPPKMSSDTARALLQGGYRRESFLLM